MPEPDPELAQTGQGYGRRPARGEQGLSVSTRTPARGTLHHCAAPSGASRPLRQPCSPAGRCLHRPCPRASDPQKWSKRGNSRKLPKAAGLKRRVGARPNGRKPRTENGEPQRGGKGPVAGARVRWQIARARVWSAARPCTRGRRAGRRAERR